MTLHRARAIVPYLSSFCALCLAALGAAVVAGDLQPRTRAAHALELPATDDDNDGLFGQDDPCSEDPRNRCAGPVALDAASAIPLRINCGLQRWSCSGPKTDCNGDLWSADFGFNARGRARRCNLEGRCRITGLTPLFGCSDRATKSLVRCGHIDRRRAPDLEYAFAVADGEYLVNMFFASTRRAAARPDARLIDIVVEGVLAHDDFDQFAAAPGSGAAVIRSAWASVRDGVLDIRFQRVTGNPAVKAIEVLAVPSRPASTTTTLGVTTTLPVSSTTSTTMAIAPIRFELADLASINRPTQAEWGPDGRLYVASLDGTITAYAFDDDYGIVDQEVIAALRGSDAPDILGLAFNPADDPDEVNLYVAHSRLYAKGGSCNFTGPLGYLGRVSRISGPGFEHALPVVTGLPTSNHDHGINGMEFDDHGDLLIAVGGTTNAGVPVCIFGGIPESPLSGAIVKAYLSRPDFNGHVTYVDRVTGLPSSDQTEAGSVEPAAGVDVEVFAAGFRNSFDLVYTTSGRVYATDNGPDLNLGPASTGPDSEDPPPHPTDDDTVEHVIENGYYGHPNRNRGRLDPRQNVYRGTADPAITGVFEQAIAVVPSSTNGIDEYRATTFGGAMRDQLIVQKWNGTTKRVELSAGGAGAGRVADLPVGLGSLDVTAGPGGALLGADFRDDKLVLARPLEQPAATPQAYDVFPWRGRERAGFVVGGRGFGTLDDTFVTIDGVPARLTHVSTTRIRGEVPPPRRDGLGLRDIVVTVGERTSRLRAAFRYLGDPAYDRGASAVVTIDPHGTMAGSSTYTASALRIDNTSPGGQQVERVRIDLSTSLLRDMVYDPEGEAGDRVGKPLTVDHSTGPTVTGHAFSGSRGGGFDVLDIALSGFAPGDSLAFSIDVDPGSIRGTAAPGPAISGSVSGLELVGAVVTVYFSDGSAHTAETFAIAGSATGSRARVGAAAPSRPGLEVLGSPSLRAAVGAADQTVRITGPAGAACRLLVVEAGLYVDASGQHDPDLQPFEANKALAVSEHAAIIEAGGFVDVPVTLTRSGPAGGLNHLVAVVEARGGETSRNSPVAIFALEP